MDAAPLRAGLLALAIMSGGVATSQWTPAVSADCHTTSIGCCTGGGNTTFSASFSPTTTASGCVTHCAARNPCFWDGDDHIATLGGLTLSGDVRRTVGNTVTYAPLFAPGQSGVIHLEVEGASGRSFGVHVDGSPSSTALELQPTDWVATSEGTMTRDIPFTVKATSLTGRFDIHFTFAVHGHQQSGPAEGWFHIETLTSATGATGTPAAPLVWTVLAVGVAAVAYGLRRRLE